MKKEGQGWCQQMNHKCRSSQHERGSAVSCLSLQRRAPFVRCRLRCSRERPVTVPLRHNPWPFFLFISPSSRTPETVVQNSGHETSHSPFRSFSWKCDSFVKKSSREKRPSLFIRAEISLPVNPLSQLAFNPYVDFQF